MEIGIDEKLLKDFIDNIPEPILILKKKSLIIEYANYEFLDFYKKSFVYLNKKKISEVFKNELFFLSNLKEIIANNGTFLIKEALEFNSKKLNVVCLLPERVQNYMMLIFKQKELNIENSIYDDFNAFEHFFSIISHEVSNPLSSIKIASQLLSKTKIVDDELIDIINTESERIAKIIVSIAQLTSKLTLQKKNNENIHELLRYSTFKIKNKPKKIEFIEEFDPSLPYVNVDKDTIIQVFDNLLLNAYEASNNDSNSFIKLSTRFLYGETIKIPNIKKSQKRNYIIIKIEDNGLGFKENEKQKIFLPFYSLKKRGSGIGLYLVKRIVDLHEGEIFVNRDEKITSFTVKLPL